MDLEKIASQNEYSLRKNTYPGRGIIIGSTPDENNYIQIYWIMGRTENSRNRILEIENDSVKTKIFNENIEGDRSLIIYYPIKLINDFHIISNGDQTDTLYEYISRNLSFENALGTREFEPDSPNYTPRITGFIDLRQNNNYGLSILKTIEHNKEYCQRQFFYYNKFINGFGHCIHTYNGNGSPLPSFNNEPYLIKLHNKIEDNLEYIWNIINKENKVSILVKYIGKFNKKTKIKIINCNTK